MAKSSNTKGKVDTQQVINVDNNLYNYDYLKLQVDNCNLKIDKLTLLFEKYILNSDKNVLNNDNFFLKDDNLSLKDENIVSNGSKNFLNGDNPINNADIQIPEVDKTIQQERIQSAISEYLIDKLMKKSIKSTKDRLNRMALYLFENEEIEYGELRKHFGFSIAQFSRDVSLLFASGLFRNLRKSMTNYITLTQKGIEIKEIIIKA